MDLSDEGKLTFQIDIEATKPLLLERTGIDLDEAGSAASNYVVVTKLYPQADTLNSSDTTMNFSFGATDILRNTPTYGSNVTFDIATDHQDRQPSCGTISVLNDAQRRRLQRLRDQRLRHRHHTDRLEVMSWLSTTRSISPTSAIHPATVPRARRGVAPLFHLKSFSASSNPYRASLRLLSRVADAAPITHAKEWFATPSHRGTHSATALRA